MSSIPNISACFTYLREFFATLRNPESNQNETMKPDTNEIDSPKPPFTSGTILRFTTTIHSHRYLAELVRALNPYGQSVFFKIAATAYWGPRKIESTLDLPLSLIDSALDAAQQQVDEIGIPGSFAHYTPGGRQLVFELVPKSEPEEPPSAPTREDLAFVAGWLNKHARLTTSTRRKSFT
jgi:hypothetical protein